MVVAGMEDELMLKRLGYADGVEGRMQRSWWLAPIGSRPRSRGPAIGCCISSNMKSFTVGAVRSGRPPLRQSG